MKMHNPGFIVNNSSVLFQKKKKTFVAAGFVSMS